MANEQASPSSLKSTLTLQIKGFHIYAFKFPAIYSAVLQGHVYVNMSIARSVYVACKMSTDGVKTCYGDNTMAFNVHVVD